MTVQDLIDELSKRDLNQVVVIDDADTGWFITKIHVGAGSYGPQAGDTRLHLWGEYSEMEKE